MLNAIIHGKAGRIDLDQDTKSLSWRQLYQQREDLLTAAFFSRFTYLSGLRQHQLLKKWLGGVGDFTTFKSIDFWPRYELSKRDDRNFVEPDLLLRFEDCDLLVEVKPPLGGNQYYEQWVLEIEGYFAQEDKTKPLYFLAIGRVGNVLDKLDVKNIGGEDNQLLAANVMEWEPIAAELYKLSHSGDLDAQDYRIVGDMIKALELYGIRASDLLWSDLKDFIDKPQLSLSVLDAWKK